jgi:methyl-accepting chemotaxis protein
MPDFSDRAWFKRTLQELTPLVDRDVVTSRVTGKPIVILTAPITTPSGRLVGVVSAGVDLDSIAGLTQFVRLGKSGYAAVATQDGTWLAHGDPTLRDLVPDARDLPIWPLVAEAKDGAISRYTDAAGNDRLAGFATVADAGWKVYVSLRHSEVEAESAGAVSRTWWWVVAVLLLALGATALLARLIVRPIDGLRNAATQIAGGDWHARAPKFRLSEIDQLGRALDSMAVSLKAMFDEEVARRDKLQTAVRMIGTTTSEVSRGDLRVRVGSVDLDDLKELGDGINAMIVSLEQIVSEIGDATNDIANAGSEILAATSQQVSATQEEATAVKQTAATVAEVRETALLVSRKATSVAETARRAAEVSEDGAAAVGESVAASRSAKSELEDLANRMLAFTEQVQAIAEINATVNDLAEQSNLLAVNASIEAVKAGDAGKGFSVVANEVKNLADQSKEATAQVRRIIIDVQRAAQAAMLATERTVKSSEQGVTLANRSGEAIRRLTDDVNAASQAAEQILASTQQQTVGMDQITLAIENIEVSSSQTTAAAQQVEATARQLNDLGKRLHTLVERVHDPRRAAAE